MAAETEEWILKLVDQATGTSARIAGGLSALDAAQIRTAESAIRLDQALRAASAAQAQTFKNPTDLAAKQKAQDANARAQLAAAKQQIAAREAATKAEEAARTKTQKGIAEQAKAAKQASADQAKAGSDAYKTISAPIDAATEALKGMGPKGAAAAIAIKVAFVVATIAIAATVGALYKCAQAALEIVALRAQLTATFSALSGGAAGGARTLTIVDKLSERLPFATAKLAEWATALQKAGLQRKALDAALRGVAAATAIMGESGGAAAEELISKLALGGAEALQLIGTLKLAGPAARAQLAEMGLRITDITSALGMTLQQFRAARVSAKTMGEAIEKALAKKGAGPLAMQTLSLSNTIAKVKEGFYSLFDGLEPAIKPFLASVRSLFSGFMKGGSTINALKPIVTSVMSTIFGWATRAVNAIHAMGIALVNSTKSGGMLAGVVIVLKAGWTALSAIFSAVVAALTPIYNILKRIFTSALVLDGLKAIFTVLAFVVVAVVVAIGVLLGVIAAVAGVVAGAIGAIVGFITAAIGLGADFVMSIVTGIQKGAGALVASIKDLGNKALDTFRSVFDMHSPSRILVRDGDENIAGAAAMGVDKGRPKMEAAMERLGPEDSPLAGGSSRSGGRTQITTDKGNGLLQKVFHFHNCIFGGDLNEEKVDAMMSAWLERTSRGAPEPEGA